MPIRKKSGNLSYAPRKSQNKILLRRVLIILTTDILSINHTPPQFCWRGLGCWDDICYKAPFYKIHIIIYYKINELGKELYN